ncbi:hypothetical protein ACFPN7_26020 [Amycolatopsis halotolerans]|uniref:hypothetical protein n=1 Tax=Amycolatopsis halotolerans TaxID=330083 RepID=UPI003614DB0C
MQSRFRRAEHALQRLRESAAGVGGSQEIREVAAGRVDRDQQLEALSKASLAEAAEGLAEPVSLAVATAPGLQLVQAQHQLPHRVRLSRDASACEVV